MGHTAVSVTLDSSVTLYICQHGAKDNYCNFASFNRAVDTKTCKNPNGVKYIKTLVRK